MMRHNLTMIQVLRSTLAYDPASGLFRYLRAPSNGRVRVGDIAGGINAQGYRIINIAGKRHKAHRLAFLFMEGAVPEGEVDHLNGERADNRWENLRAGSKADNQANVLAPRVDNQSGFRGVHKLGGRSKRWIARAWVLGRRVTIGHFDTPEEAGGAYLAFRKANLQERGIASAR